MLRQGDEGTSLDEIFRKAEIDLPQQFRTIDYVRDRSRFGESDPQSTFHGRTYGGDHPRGGSRSVSEVAKRHGISEPMIYAWRKRFGGFGASDVRRLKQLEAENARLKKLVAERDLDKKLVSVPARRRQVAYGREHGLSARRACTLFSVARSALSYKGRKVTKDAHVVERMKELSAQYPRYGYRRIRRLGDAWPDVPDEMDHTIDIGDVREEAEVDHGAAVRRRVR